MGKAEKPEKTNKKQQKHFWKDFKAELKKVIWPTRSQVVNSTIIIIVIVLIVTAIVFVLDLAFEALNTYGIDKLKTFVHNTVVTDEGKDNETENTNTAGESGNANENTDNNNADNNDEQNTSTENNGEGETEPENNTEAPNDQANVEDNV